MTWVMAGGALVKLGGSLFGASKSKKARRDAERKAARLDREITSLENSRGAVVNPYADMTDLSGAIKDNSSMASNNLMNLSVATGAAEMQAEEADIALANTLDTLASTGASAGGATALAQAALKSKQGVSNTIETQEVANQTMREQSRIKGEERLQNIRMDESSKVQDAKFSEGQRIQNATAQGKAYVYEEQQDRINRKIARKTGQEAAANQEAAAAGAAEGNAMAGVFSAASGLAGQGLGALMKG